MTPRRPDALILSGGGARRLGGADKAAVTVGGMTLLEHAVSAAQDCGRVIVVGPEAPASPEIRFTREDPPGGGPVAGIAAGLEALGDPAALVLVLACDMPRAASALQTLLAEAEAGVRSEGIADVDGVWAVDGGGRVQPLLAVYRSSSLADALAHVGDAHGASMRALTSRLTMRAVEVGDAARDADTWEDVRALREEWS